jgi:ribA/ribD-fused uncharacterized protein
MKIQLESYQLRITQEVVLFYMGTPFCNFFPALFTDSDGVSWGTSEAYFVAQKCEFHGNAQAALYCWAHSDHPMSCKSMGRYLFPYDKKWEQGPREQAMYNAVSRKFRSSYMLARALLATGNRTLAEASPTDPWWGIGLAVTDPAALDPVNWKGTNLLGKCLMQVRRELRRTVIGRKALAEIRRRPRLKEYLVTAPDKVWEPSRGYPVARTPDPDEKHYSPSGSK